MVRAPPDEACRSALRQILSLSLRNQPLAPNNGDGLNDDDLIVIASPVYSSEPRRRGAAHACVGGAATGTEQIGRAHV